MKKSKIKYHIVEIYGWFILKKRFLFIFWPFVKTFNSKQDVYAYVYEIEGNSNTNVIEYFNVNDQFDTYD